MSDKQPWGSKTFKCTVEKCFGCSENGTCAVLEERTNRQKKGLGCPFYKSKEQYRKELAQHE